MTVEENNVNTSDTETIKKEAEAATAPLTDADKGNPVLETGRDEAKNPPASDETLLSKAGPNEKGKTDPNDKEPDKPGKNEEKPPVYEDFKVPEGVTLDAEKNSRFKELAGKMKLTQEQAQELVDFEAEHMQTFTKSLEEKYQNAYFETVESWKAQALEKLGAEPEKKLAVAHGAIERFATPEFKELLAAPKKDGSGGYGWGNLLPVIETMINVGNAFANDAFVDGKRSGADAPKSAGELIFPTMAKNTTEK